MTAVHSLVPARFLTLTAHLVIVITIFWSRESNVRACLPLDFTQEEFNAQDTQLVVALSVTLGLFAVELAGSGPARCTGGSLASAALAAHCSASVSLSFFVFQEWECWTYWVIFAFCSAVPALVEVFLFIAVLGLKRKPL
ncbi:hypothetical protein JZ751_024354 [Albula glossodonta]|uniref:Transmembrane protein 107 n=1 Tax=Albula glossodonta TaxID=121402 RepID=A0A8T2NEK7_9TELE|nr:hypothetical protein JZ751_024354 [Albula glossodonta]